MEILQATASNSPSDFGTPSRRSSTTRLGPWSCGNCGREFALKEYRHKHQQRCILASKRGRQSKQKSCLACAASKLGCDREAPCSRCRQRNKPCQYPSKSGTANATRAAFTAGQPPRELMDEPEAREWTQTLESEPNGTVEGSAGWPTHSADTATEAEVDLFGLDSWQHIGQTFASSANDVLSHTFANDDSAEVYDPSFGLDLSASATINEEVMHATSSNGTGSPRPSKQPTEQQTLHDAMTKVHGPDRPQAENTTPSTCPFAKITSDDALVALIRSYPRLMVRPGIYPPFVHHLLYPCETGEVAEPLAKAFCCVGAFYASLPTSRSFVCAMMSEESDKLVKSFNRNLSSDAEMLAVIHAMCVYQMVGFFGGGDKNDVRAAETRHPVFLKMTRLLVRQHLNEQPSEEVGKVAWRHWIMSETIRRTVLLVNVINILSCRVEKQDRLFFEPLGIVRDMLLPAQDAMWKASTAEEWAAARRSTGDGITLHQALDQLDTTGRLGSPFGELEELDGFMHLIIYTAGIEKHL